jgi:hypothetical protein
MKISQTSDATTADSRWKGLSELGGVATLMDEEA